MNKKYAIIPILIIGISFSAHAMWTRLPRQSSQVRQAAIRQPQTRSFQARLQSETQTPEVNIMEETTTPIAQQQPEIQTYTPTESPSSTTQQISSTIQQLPQKHSLTTTIQPTIRTMPAGFEKPTTSLWSYWTALKNKLFGSRNVPAVPFSRTPTSTEEPIFPEKLISWIDAIKTLPEAKKLLQNFTQTAFDDIKIKAHIPEKVWTHLIEKEHSAINYIQQHCFIEPHPNATWDTMPEELQELIETKLNNENINPTSLSVHYRDMVEINPFGHDTISVTGPTIIYKTDTSGENVITGYEPATITLHKQNIAKLTKNQFVEKLQHTITHLKQAHNEQIILLKKAIGPEKFEQYAQPYKQALEREADLLESIKNAQVAKVVQRAFLDDTLDITLKEIKNTRERLGLENKETGLMVCAPPGDLPQFLLDMESFDDMKKYIYEKKEAIAREYFEGDEELLDEWKKTQDEHYLQKLQKIAFKAPRQNVIHDQALPPFLLEETKRLLIKVGINPLSINICSKKNYKKINSLEFPDKAGGVAYGQHFSQKDLTPLNIPSIGLNEDFLANRSHETILRVITHEIGHLLRMHTTIKLDNIYYSKSRELLFSDDPLFLTQKKLEQQYKSLQELEADITYALSNPLVAQISFSSIMIPITKGSSSSKRSSPIHPSINERYYWFRRINQLHLEKEAHEKTKMQPLFAPERE